MNWQQRIDKAREVGHFADGEFLLSLQWNSCAVGEHKGMYPVDARAERLEQPNMPDSIKARELYVLGCDFHAFVKCDNIEKAQKTYDAIQEWFKNNQPEEPVILYPMVMDAVRETVTVQ